MKLYRNCLLVFFFIVSSALVGQDSLRIGFSLGDFYVDRWHKDRDLFVENANSLGAKVYCEYAYGDAEKQLQQVDKLMDEGLKLIVIVPTDASVFDDIVKKANSSGVTIISYDRLIVNANIDYYISFDNEKVGRLQAQFATSKVPKGNYILLAGPVKDNNAVQFLGGQKEILKPYIKQGDIKILLEKHLSEWSSMEAFLELQTFFESNTEKIDAVIASNDLIASGSLMAFEMYATDNNIILTGQDANADAVKNIYKGSQSMTIYKPISKLAAQAAQLSVDILKGKEIQLKSSVNNKSKDIPAMLLEPIVVTKENIKSTVIADGYYTESEIFGED